MIVNSLVYSRSVDAKAKLDPECPEGWSRYDDRTCVMIRPLLDVSWRDAAFGCSYFGGSLLKLRDEAMLEYLRQQQPSDMMLELLWIGAHDHGNETFWKNVDGSVYTGLAIDILLQLMSAFTREYSNCFHYRPWAPDQPDNRMSARVQIPNRQRRSNGKPDVEKELVVSSSNDVGSAIPLSGEQCAIIDQGEVYDLPCEMKAKGYVCERPRVGLTRCPWNMVLFEGILHSHQGCYK